MGKEWTSFSTLKPSSRRRHKKILKIPSCPSLRETCQNANTWLQLFCTRLGSRKLWVLLLPRLFPLFLKWLHSKTRRRVVFDLNSSSLFDLTTPLPPSQCPSFAHKRLPSSSTHKRKATIVYTSRTIWRRTHCLIPSTRTSTCRRCCTFSNSTSSTCVF